MSGTPAAGSSMAPSREASEIQSDQPRSQTFETTEARVRQLLESKSATDNVIILFGPSGVGKTTLLRSITEDTAVQSKYQCSMRFIELGEQTSYPKFIIQLVRFIQGRATQEWINKFAALALDRVSQGDAIRSFVEEVTNLTLPALLVLDNICSHDGTLYRFIQDLAEAIRNANSNFKIVMSTRYRHILTSYLNTSVVEFLPHSPIGQAAKSILCEHAGLKNLERLQTLSPEAMYAATSILDKCSGFPLALCIAGRAIEYFQTSSASPNILWVQCWERMKETNEVVPRSSSPGHTVVYHAVTLSISALGPIWPSYLTFSPQELLSSLCVFKKGTEISLEILSLMWNVATGAAQEVAHLFCRQKLVSHVNCSADELNWTYTIHETIHCWVLHNAERMGKVSFWHQQLISRSEQVPSSRTYAEDDATQFWVSDEIMNNTYMKINIVYHLAFAQELTSAIRVLVDYRRIERLHSDDTQIPFHQLLDDARLLVAYIKRDDKTLDIPNGECTVTAIQNDLEYFIEALQLIMPICTANPDECVYQLHGRLCTPNGESGMFEWCLHTIEKFAKRPWCRPMEGMLDSPNQSLKRAFHPLQPIHALASQVLRHELVVAHGRSEIGIRRVKTEIGTRRVEILDSFNGHRKYILDFFNTTEGDIVPHFRPFNIFKKDDNVISLLAHADEFMALTEEGAAVVWRNQKRVRECSLFMRPHRAKCVAIVGTQMIVFGSDGGQIRLLHMKTWETIKSFVHTKGSLENSSYDELQPNPSPLKIISAGRCGTSFFSLCVNGYVRKWDVETFSSSPFEAPGQGEIDHMTVSRDSNLIAIALKKGNVHICNARSGAVKKTVAGHRGTVSCLLFSHNNQILYSGGVDKSVQYWSVRRGTRMVKPFRQHQSKISSLALSRDGSELFSASARQICVSHGVPRRFGNFDFGLDSGFSSKVYAYCLSWDKKTLVTVESDRIRFRNLCDPITRYEAMCRVWSLTNDETPSLFISIQEANDSVEHVSVSPDGKTIAYAIRQRNLIDDDLSRTHIYTARRIGNSGWTRSKRLPQLPVANYPEFFASVDKLAFLVDDRIEVVFRAQLGNSTLRMLLTQSSTGDSYKWRADSDSTLDLEDWVVDPALTLKSGNTIQYGSRIMGKLDRCAMPHRYIWSSVAKNAVLFDSENSRLWILNEDSRLQYVDLVKSGPSNDLVAPCPLPSIRVNRAPGTQSKIAKLKNRNEVYISCAGADRVSIGVPLSEVLREKGISCIVSENSASAVEELPVSTMAAMEEAKLWVVILSPEYAAGKLTLKQLEWFQKRMRMANLGNNHRGKLLPVFYRLSRVQCQSLNLVSDMEIGDQATREEYQRLVSEGAVEIWDMRMIMETLSKVDGAESVGESGMTEKRRDLIAQVCDVVEVVCVKD